MYDGTSTRMNMYYVASYSVAFSGGASTQAHSVETITGQAVKTTQLKASIITCTGAQLAYGINSSGFITMTIPKNTTYSGNLDCKFLIFYK